MTYLGGGRQQLHKALVTLAGPRDWLAGRPGPVLTTHAGRIREKGGKGNRGEGGRVDPEWSNTAVAFCNASESSRHHHESAVRRGRRSSPRSPPHAPVLP